eukprot:79885_1
MSASVRLIHHKNQSDEEVEEKCHQTEVQNDVMPSNRSSINYDSSIYDTSDINPLKTTRSMEEIDEYLKHYVPPYIDYTTLPKAFAFTVVPLLINVYFIIDNFVTLQKAHEKPNDMQNYLWMSKNIVIWFEFCGLIFILLSTIFISIFYKKSRASIINGAINCKSWSSFKLFYKFRPSAVYDYLLTCYKHQSEGDDSYKTKKMKLKKLDYILSELKNEIDAERDAPKYTTEQMQNVFQELSNQIKHDKKQIQLNTVNAKQTIEVTCDHCCSNAPFVKTLQWVTWFTLATIMAVSLLLGTMSLLLKLSQLSFINHKGIFSLSGYELYFVLAFCNQLWNMTNEDQIRVDTIYKCLFMDNIQSKYTRYVAENTLYIDTIFKHNLWENHGWKGALLSLQTNWKLVLKVVFKSSVDTVLVPECYRYQYITEELHKLEAQINDSGSKFKMVNRVNSKLKNTQHSQKWNFAMKSHWKPFHPYSYVQYELLQRKRQKYSERQKMWIMHPAAVYDYLRTIVKYSFPCMYLISTVLCIMVLISGYNGEWVNEFTVYACCCVITITTILFALKDELMDKLSLQDESTCRFILNLLLISFIFFPAILELILAISFTVNWYGFLSTPIMVSTFFVSLSVCIYQIGLFIIFFALSNLVHIVVVMLIYIMGFTALLNGIYFIVGSIWEINVLFGSYCSSDVPFVYVYRILLVVTVTLVFVIGIVHFIVSCWRNGIKLIYKQYFGKILYEEEHSTCRIHTNLFLLKTQYRVNFETK